VPSSGHLTTFNNNWKTEADRKSDSLLGVVHTVVHNNDVYDCLAMTQDAVRALVNRCKAPTDCRMQKATW
jgi:hypothetical protein